MEIPGLFVARQRRAAWPVKKRMNWQIVYNFTFITLCSVFYALCIILKFLSHFINLFDFLSTCLIFWVYIWFFEQIFDFFVCLFDFLQVLSALWAELPDKLAEKRLNAWELTPTSYEAKNWGFTLLPVNLNKNMENQSYICFKEKGAEERLYTRPVPDITA